MTRKRKIKLMLVPLTFIMVAAIAIVGYAAWQVNFESEGTLTTGNVHALNIDAEVRLTTPQTADGNDMRLVPITQNPNTFNQDTMTRFLRFSVDVLNAEMDYDLTISIVTGTLATGSELRIMTTTPELGNVTQGNAIITGATTSTHMFVTDATATTTTVTHVFYLFLVSTNLDDRNVEIDFLVTISPAL